MFDHLPWQCRSRSTFTEITASWLQYEQFLPNFHRNGGREQYHKYRINYFYWISSLQSLAVNLISSGYPGRFASTCMARLGIVVFEAIFVRNNHEFTLSTTDSKRLFNDRHLTINERHLLPWFILRDQSLLEIRFYDYLRKLDKLNNFVKKLKYKLDILEFNFENGKFLENQLCHCNHQIQK